MGSVRPLWTHHRTGQTGCAHHLGSDFLGRRLKGQAKIPKVQLRVSPERLCWSTELSEHEADRSEAEECERLS